MHKNDCIAIHLIGRKLALEPMGDLNTEAEKKLGRLVREKYVNSTTLLHFTLYI